MADSAHARTAVSDADEKPYLTYTSTSGTSHGADVRQRVKKRVVVCCDGTWEDGVTEKRRWMYTNVLRIARTINHEDPKFGVPIPQIVFYQTGVGSSDNFYSEYIEGATGGGLGEKVEEAYAFIAHNYHPGDEIFLFGFSRGAYTARMIADFIGSIGVLTKAQLDHFGDIFINLQKRGKTHDPKESAELDAKLAPWTGPDGPGLKRVSYGPDGFSIKCIGVFDTVGSVGLPEEISRKSPKAKTIFGFNDRKLGEHVQYAFHALAINETRKDFDCALFEQTDAGRAKGQVLKQCWFSGSHADIGGGWKFHDLSDITLVWMVANVSSLLSIDYKYLASIPDPADPWGAQPPHDPAVGVFELAFKIQRTLPTTTDNVTHQTIHPSVLKQKILTPALQADITANPDVIGGLLPLEVQFQQHWPYVPGNHRPSKEDAKEEKNEDMMTQSILQQAKEAAKHTLKSAMTVDTVTDQSGNEHRGLISRFNEATGLAHLVDKL